MFKEVKARWNAMSTNEKVKMIVGGICDIGCELLFVALGRKLSDPDDSRIKRWAMGLSTFALGSAAGRIASSEMDEYVDIILPEKNKEDSANA